MARPNRLKELEGEYGNLCAVIPALVNDVGQDEAGRKLGVSSATISTWLKKHGYTMQITYVRNNQQEQS